ncbi:MAG: shikimate dehydrogenase [bacterium]|nr:shikimate dehydrogenase [bacterium]
MTSAPTDLPVLCGIILHPAAHTLSPVLHAAAYRELGLSAHYHAFDVPPDSVRDALAGMRALGLRQLSVSIPHKETVLELADRASEEARRIGAANTLTRVGDEIVADNTDWIGVRKTLEPLADWKDKRATVLGAGGAARAVVFALRSLEMHVTVVNRSAERAERVARELGAEVGTLEDPFDLLVNTTPLGMSPDLDSTPAAREVLRPDSTVFDTVYRPLETRLLREAASVGCRVQDGLDMLIHQAVEQVRLWCGRAPDAENLRAAALDVLKA